MASYFRDEMDSSHALPHNLRARLALTTPTRETAQPPHAIIAYADKNPKPRNVALVFEDPRPPPKADASHEHELRESPFSQSRPQR